jgi:hypothetical protein
MPGQRIDGIALAAISGGALFVFAGIKDKSVLSIFSGLIQGHSPATAASAGAGLGGTTATGTAATGGSAASSGPSAGSAPASGSETSFYTALLKDLGAPVTPANLMSMYAWGRHEEPCFPPQDCGGNAWNPLNIKNFISGGFEQYSSAAEGAAHTAGFMLANNYPSIVAALRSGNGLCGSDPAIAAELSRWSGGGYSSVC